MRITKLPQSDLVKAYALDKRYVTGHTLATIRANYAKNPELFVACYDKNKLIGLCWGSKQRHEVILRGIAVEAKHWKKGLGKSLLRLLKSALAT